jgi:hypothetical protein
LPKRIAQTDFSALQSGPDAQFSTFLVNTFLTKRTSRQRSQSRYNMSVYVPAAAAEPVTEMVYSSAITCYRFVKEVEQSAGKPAARGRKWQISCRSGVFR